VVTSRTIESAAETAKPARKPVPDWRTRPTRPQTGALGEYTFFTVFQPIVELSSGDPVGYEALTRFADGQSPQERLAAAKAEGIGVELDAALARAALASAHALPPGTWLAVNVSAGLASQPVALAEILREAPCPLVVDVGDAPDPEQLVDGLLSRLPNVMIALDDVGAGYESLARIQRMRPSFLKLHRSAVAAIESDGARQTFVRSLVHFADENGCKVIAEGVETEAERDALRDAGVHLAQGYFVGRPVPIERMTADHLAGS
jgi:EAL domain-containing protein (putative c-di-GMP-specific phosphodiesterase class I)